MTSDLHALAEFVRSRGPRTIRADGDVSNVFKVLQFNEEVVLRELIDDSIRPFNEDDRFMDLRLFHEDTVLITYGKRSGFYQHREDGILDRSKLLHKGAF